MERKNNILNKIFSPKLLIIEWSFIVLFCIFIGCSIRSQAASSDKHLPYDYSWNYYAIPEQTLNIALNHASAYFDTSQDNVIVFWYEIGNGSWLYQFCVAQVDSITYDSGYTYDTTDLTLNKITLHFSHSVIGFTDGNSLIDPGNQAYAPQSFTFFGSNAVFVQPTGVITETYTHMPLYGTVELDGKLIIGTPEVVANGHATPPDLSGDNIGNDKPDIDNYIPTQPTAPTFDNSSLESMVESLYNWLVWQYNAITSTIKGLIKYLGDTITYSLQKVIDNIKNAIKNFYDNMKSLFEPLLNGLAQIGQAIKETIENIGLLLEAFFAPFDEDQFQEAYNNCQFITAVDGFKDSIEEFEHAFTYAEERDYYTLYLGFIMDGYTVNYDLDFSWLYPLRQYYRPIIWCVVVYEFFVYLCAQLSDYLQGRSGK